MSDENVARFQAVVEACNRGELAGVVADFAPECEFVSSGAIPGAGGTFRGPAGYRRFLESFWNVFDNPSLEVHELIDAGDQVLASLTLRGNGKESGVEASMDVWQLWTVRDGEVVRGEGFTSRSDALEAAGLSE